MSEPRRHHRYTYAQYSALEAVSDEKHEYIDGEIYVMAGGSEEHSALAAETIYALRGAIGDRRCRVHTSDLRIYVDAVGLATYPDGSVICGPMQQHEASPQSTAVNPMILVEVTSESSEAYDTGLKRQCYQTIESLREYIVVSHRERRVTVHAREGEGWTTLTATAGERVEIPSLQAHLAVDEIYRNSSIT